MHSCILLPGLTTRSLSNVYPLSKVYLALALRVHWYTMGKQSGHLPGPTGAPVH